MTEETAPKQSILQDLPPISLGIMTDEEENELLGRIRAIDKKQMWRSEFATFVEQCYARLWLNICREECVQPITAASKTNNIYKSILPKFVAIAASAKIHSKYNLIHYHAPKIALLAQELIKQK